MLPPPFPRNPRARSARRPVPAVVLAFAAAAGARAVAVVGLLTAVLAMLMLGAALCAAAQPAAPARTAYPAFPARLVPPEPVAPTTRPVAPLPAVHGGAAVGARAAEAGDAETTGTLYLADLDKALSNDLVSLDKPDLQRLLGESPEFVYDPHNKRDPMVLPWEHMRVRAVALLAEAGRALKFGNLDLAERLYEMVRSTVGEAEAQQLPGLDSFGQFRAQADAGSQKVLAEKQRMALVASASASGGSAVKAVVPLPVWVRTHTSGVVFSKQQPLCLVGPYTLKVGDKVPGQAVEVEVVKIERRAVTYRVAGETFVVGLEEGE